MKELSLRPYHGRLFLAADRADYDAQHIEIFDEPDVISCTAAARFTGGCGKDGMWTYLVWADAPHLLAHELSHAILHVFERCGIDPRCGSGEPFCYMLSQLILEAGEP